MNGFYVSVARGPLWKKKNITFYFIVILSLIIYSCSGLLCVFNDQTAQIQLFN